MTNEIDSSTPARWAKTWLDKVETVVKDGLPEVYEADVFSWLCDMYADLPWTPDNNEAVQDKIKADPRWESLQTSFVERFGELL